MFHWICPECGREIPPAMKECPACDPSAVPLEAVAAAPEPASAAPKPVEPAAPEVPSEAAPVAAAPAPVETPPVNPPPVNTGPIETKPVNTPPVETPPVNTPPVEVAPVNVTPPVEPAPAAPPPAPAAELPKPVEAAPVEPAPIEVKTVEPISVPAPAPAPVPVLAVEPDPDPMLALAEWIRAAQQNEIAEPAPALVEAQGLPQLAAAVGLTEVPAAPAEPPKPAAAEAHQEKPVEVPASEVPASEVPASVKATPATAPQAVALLAPPEPPPAPAPAAEALAPVVRQPEPAPAPEPQQVQASAPVVKDLVEPPPPGDKPPSGSWLQLAPLQDYSSAATRAMRPATPPVQILTPDAGPKITLPGPALPPKLERLQEASIVTVIGEAPARAKRRGMPGWLISLMLMLGIPIAGAGLLFYFQPVTRSADAKAPAVQEAAQTATPEPASHSVSGFVEVTGFRIVVDYNKKSEIHYLVVNHSAAELSDMTIFVTLRTANSKPGQPPLSRFSFRAPSLGPFESKEMVSPIEKMSRSVQLPDWQDLRADVQVGQ